MIGPFLGISLDFKFFSVRLAVLATRVGRSNKHILFFLFRKEICRTKEEKSAFPPE